MLDEQDQGTRIGIGVALGIALLLVIGLTGWLAIRSAKPPARTAQAAMAGAEAFVDAPLSRQIVGVVYFAVGQATLPPESAAVIAAIKQAAGAAEARKIVLSGFHDATGDPAKNAELAKNRAKTMRAALQAEGIAPARIVLRKPESTMGDGSNQEARRVEVRLAE
jgi:outer membrane protein OmpA-like peptidoglycan-associated protein